MTDSKQCRKCHIIMSVTEFRLVKETRKDRYKSGDGAYPCAWCKEKGHEVFDHNENKENQEWCRVPWDRGFLVHEVA